MKVTARATFALVTLLAASQVQGAFISSVVKTGGNDQVPVITDLVEGVEAFTDRNHILVNVPTALESGDQPQLVQLSNDDKSSTDVNHAVTIDKLSILYVGLDDRFDQPKPWMNDPGYTGLPTTFFDTGAQIDIDEGADGSINQSFSLWATLAPAGTYNLGTNETSGNMYIVFADNKLIPEPGTISLLGMGVLGLLGIARRRR